MFIIIRVANHQAAAQLQGIKMKERKSTRGFTLYFESGVYKVVKFIHTTHFQFREYTISECSFRF